MSIILELKTAEWTLRVRANKNQERWDTLQKILKARKVKIPASKILLSPPIVGSLNEENAELQRSEIALLHPIFFENKQYHFTLTFSSKFKSDTSPTVKHRLRSIEEAFFYDEDSRILSGSVDFANNVGWFRLGFGYRKDNIEQVQYISFEVFPVKMAMKKDLAHIHQTIDSQYPLWRFSFAKQTDQELSRSNAEHDHFPLLWLAHFANLRKALVANTKIILRAPHTRLLADSRRVHLHQLRGRLPAKLEERVKEHIDNKEDHHRYLVRSRHLSSDTPENRFIKMALTQCKREISNILDIARKNQPAPEEGRLSDSFFEELENWKTPLEQLLNQPFFSDIRRYEGMERESLVLHQRAGYSQVYRIWQQLKMYLDLFGNNAAVSMKSVADLYEVWCFLRLKEILESFGLQEQSTTKHNLSRQGLEMSMKDGTHSTFHLYRDIDKLTVKLSHEPHFGKPKAVTGGGIYSWTTEQKPDIFLEAQFGDGPTLRWIFDAKYRIDDKNGIDRAPEDAINQMHRYRDAIIHIDKKLYGENAKSRPVLGAFVLYPGWFDEAKVSNPSQDAINEVGIGAFPLLPGHPNLWLERFLEKRFGKATLASTYRRSFSDRYLIEDSVNIPVTGMYEGQFNDLCLCVNLGDIKDREADYIQNMNNGTAKWYHVMTSKTLLRSISLQAMKETRFCAIALPTQVENNDQPQVISFIYKVLKVEICPGTALSLEKTGKVSEDTVDFWLIQLGEAAKLSQPITLDNSDKDIIFHTSAAAIQNGSSFNALPRYYPNLIFDASNTESAFEKEAP